MRFENLSKEVLHCCPECGNKVSLHCWKQINLDEPEMKRVLVEGINCFSCSTCDFFGAVPLFYSVYSVSRLFCFICFPPGTSPGSPGIPSIGEITGEITSGKFDFKLVDSFSFSGDLVDSVLMLDDGLDYKKGLYYKKNPPLSLITRAAEKTPGFVYDPSLTKYMGIHSNIDEVAKGALFGNRDFRFLIPIGNFM